MFCGENISFLSELCLNGNKAFPVIRFRPPITRTYLYIHFFGVLVSSEIDSDSQFFFTLVSYGDSPFLLQEPNVSSRIEYRLQLKAPNVCSCTQGTLLGLPFKTKSY